MKKLISLLLAVAVCASISGCGANVITDKNNENQANTGSTEQSTTKPIQNNTPAPAPGNVLRIEQGEFNASAQDFIDAMNILITNSSDKITKFDNVLNTGSITYYTATTGNGLDIGLSENNATKHLTLIGVNVPKEKQSSAANAFWGHVFALIQWSDPQVVQNGTDEYTKGLNLDNMAQFTLGHIETYQKNNIWYTFSLNDNKTTSFSLIPVS